jgi:hypothetical protein
MPEYPNGHAVTDTLSSTGAGTEFSATTGRPIFLSVTGTWVGTIKVQRSHDGGDSWNDMTAGGAAWASFTANCDEVVDEAAHSALLYRVHFTRTSGTAECRLGH